MSDGDALTALEERGYAFCQELNARLCAFVAAEEARGENQGAVIYRAALTAISYLLVHTVNHVAMDGEGAKVLDQICGAAHEALRAAEDQQKAQHI